MKTCISWLGLPRAHKYEARYDEVPTRLDGLEVERASVAQLRSLMYHRKYVHDVCTRCGDVIKREAL